MNSLSLKYQKITKPRNFLDFSRKSSISLCRVFYQRKNRFPYPFIYLRLKKGTPFEMLRAEPPLLGHYREYPLPRSPVPESLNLNGSGLSRFSSNSSILFRAETLPQVANRAPYLQRNKRCAWRWVSWNDIEFCLLSSVLIDQTL